jgi:menaquinone-dependent protoporphyrinogen IX oxidase
MSTLIVYGSRRGSTRACAELIQQTLGDAAALADVSRKIPDLAAYDRVVIGANAFASRLNKRVMRFVRKHLSELIRKEVHLFVCSGSKNESEVRRSTRRAIRPSCWPHPALPIIWAAGWSWRKSHPSCAIS